MGISVKVDFCINRIDTEIDRVDIYPTNPFLDAPFYINDLKKILLDIYREVSF